MRRFVAGNVYLVEASLPADSVEERTGGRLLAVGEGFMSKVHARAFTAPDGSRYVSVHGGFGTLRVRQHGVISVPTGTYRVMSVEGREVDGW